ncbi:hypothetical protein BO78DRAFT_147649 [Aspergillus sclerotiicarbonarius CBS 121057]|uniref:Uncharacterized protein n=1 Tax=Aspergillus sclerotiicarbonarius (strain CBS 121057 / IBT 28362) TaxID=1448318 RepID=A0A319EUW8_ASPSB|nr:hypothetical protein BO78DRAFT_147649 [Aspergillus sclerotiicarbonarius CBS 121057]
MAARDVNAPVGCNHTKRADRGIPSILLHTAYGRYNKGKCPGAHLHAGPLNKGNPLLQPSPLDIQPSRGSVIRPMVRSAARSLRLRRRRLTRRVGRRPARHLGQFAQDSETLGSADEARGRQRGP